MDLFHTWNDSQDQNLSALFADVRIDAMRLYTATGHTHELSQQLNPGGETETGEIYVLL